MKSGVVQSLLVLLVCFAITPMLEAQRAGFQAAGITPVINSPVQPFRQAPVQPFLHAPVQPFSQPFIQATLSAPNGLGFGIPALGVTPIATPFPGSAFPPPAAPPWQHQPHHSRRNNNVTVIVPNGTVITQGPVIIQQPQAVLGYPTHGNQQAAPSPFLAPGMPRDEVLKRFGAPVTSVFTNSGETLLFNGGETVFIQNGKVATTSRPN